MSTTRPESIVSARPGRSPWIQSPQRAARCLQDRLYIPFSFPFSPKFYFKHLTFPRRRHPARRPRRVHRRLRLGQVVARLRHALRRGAAPLPRVGGAVRAPAVRPAGRRPEVDAIDGLPPAVALQQRAAPPTTRSSVGSVTTLSNLLRMLYSRAGHYPRGSRCLVRRGVLAQHAEGACPTCHGLGRVYDATERSMVPDPSLTIRERAIAAWPAGVARAEPARHPRHPRLRRRPAVARAAEEGPRLDPLHRRAAAGAGLLRSRPSDAARISADEPDYMGTFWSARRYVLHTFADDRRAR